MVECTGKYSDTKSNIASSSGSSDLNRPAPLLPLVLELSPYLRNYLCPWVSAVMQMKLFTLEVHHTILQMLYTGDQKHFQIKHGFFTTLQQRT